MVKTPSRTADDLPGHRRAISVRVTLLGVALIICGAIAIVSPAISTMAVTLFLGLILASGGIVKIAQAFPMKQSGGFAWQALAGVIELLGGLLVYFNPMKGAIAITIVIALVLMAEGLPQLGLAFRMRAQRGVVWMVLSGVITLAVGPALAMRLSYDRAYAPGTLVGISLLFAGWAYVALALAARRVTA
jgi:uncharacterized membrane protein HdeD (DUF308 family)